MGDTKKVLFALVAVMITVGYLWQTNSVVTPKEATWDDVMTEARQGGYQIIRTDELWARYEKDPDKMLLVDTRQEWEYRTGHIKGALNFPIESMGYPEWHAKNLSVETSSAGLVDISQQSDTSKPLKDWAIIWTLLGIFAGGIALNLTPCVYPLISITVSYFGSLFMGITLGVVAAPCIGPFVLGLLTWVASMGNPWIGFLIFFTLSIGLGLPLFILAMFSSN